MAKRKTLSLLSLGGVALLLSLASASPINKGRLALAEETSDTRFFLLSAQDIGSALEEGENEVYAGGLTFSFFGASYVNKKATFKGGYLYNETLAGENANAAGRIGTGFKKVVFEGLENASGLTVSFLSDASTVLESKSLEAGSSLSEVSLSVEGKAKMVKITFNSGTGVSFASIAYHYTCGNV